MNMSSGIASLHKILKDETRRKILLLLSEKGALSYTDLMEAMGFATTGLLNYHLKVLSDLLSKNENGQYTLTEKGKLASRLLLEFPEENRKQLGMKPKWWRKFWIAQTIIGTALLVISLVLYFLGYADANRLYQSIISIISAIGIAYMITHILRDVLSEKARLRLNRAMYVFLGIFIIGFFLWIALMTFLRASGIDMLIGNTFGSAPSAILSFILCYVIGAFIGNWLGKRRNYHLPQWPT
jgi:DNA-binding transcriptional ArsR family regulator